jgi:hypothetical protein
MNSRITTLEACQILFRGQSNVKVMANKLNMPLEELQEVFRVYCKNNPVDENVWKGDIELSWPYGGA